MTRRSNVGGGYLLDRVTPDQVVCPEDMGEAERLLMRTIQEFADREVTPAADEIDRRNIEVVRPLFEKAAELGLFMAEVPETHGGLGLSLLAVAGMAEARSYLGGLASTVFAHQGVGTLPLVHFGTPSQIERYLPSLMAGERMAAFALTEPGSGSDAINIRTTAVLNEAGTHYVVNGAKQWITNAGWADLFVLFAKVDGTDFSAFLLERDTPGLVVGQPERLMGQPGSCVCPLQLTDVAIPVDRLLGEVGKGHRVALCTLNIGRMKMAANCAGLTKKILATTTAYAVERRQFGRPIAEFGLIERKLADMAAASWAAEAVAYRTAGLVYDATEAQRAGGDLSLDETLRVQAEFAMECALAKVIGTETYNGMADEALQIYGGNGYSEDYPAARWYRDSRITRIYEGTSEICRLSMAKTLFRRVEEGRLDLLPLATGATWPPAARGDDLEALLQQAHGLKQVFLDVFREIWSALDESARRAPDAQQHLGGMADIALEIFRAESTTLRAAKLASAATAPDRVLHAALSRLTLHQAASRIRRAATEVLGALLTGDRLRDAVSGVTNALPVPVGLIQTRHLVARELVARRGVLAAPPTLASVTADATPV